MSDYTENESFFENGYKMIYEWLNDEEKYDFDNEIKTEEDQFGLYKSWEERFYRALNYVQVKYVNIYKYISEIDKNISKIDVKFNDIVFIDYNNDEFYLSDIKRSVYNVKPEESFSNLLESLELKEKYNYFMESEKKVRWEK